MKELAVIIFYVIVGVAATALPSKCDVTAETEYGTVCGRTRVAANGDKYASFRGIRYAKAPLAELRFAVPQRPDPYDDIFDASEHGPICPQYDVIYGPIMQPRSTDEDCLRINVHVPISSLPEQGTAKPLLPVFVFIHGGSFNYGSGDTDLHGPEYLMAGKGVLLITFNYRIGPFGFMSLYSKEIPGNTGLRDAVFALQWVQNNVEKFGGDPAAVTLGGQSAGAAVGHLLTISPAVEEMNLFQRFIGLSGSAIAGFVTPTKAYSKLINAIYLNAAGINQFQSPASIHRDLCKAPLDKLVEANAVILNFFGITSFSPIIEDEIEGLTAVVPKNPELLLDEGYGKDKATWLGFCKKEAQLFKKRLEEINMEMKGRLLPFTTVPFNILCDSNLLTVPVTTKMMSMKYFNNTRIELEKWLPAITDGFFKYTAMRIAKKRNSVNAETTFISEFGYKGSNDPFKITQGRDWPSAAHCEDLPYIFRTNSVLGEVTTDELSQDNDDSRMKNLMTDYVAQFTKTGSPVLSTESCKWPSAGRALLFQSISAPQGNDFGPPTPYMEDKIEFFDLMNKIARGM